MELYHVILGMSGRRFNFITEHSYKSIPENFSDLKDLMSKLQEHTWICTALKIVR